MCRQAEVVTLGGSRRGPYMRGRGSTGNLKTNSREGLLEPMNETAEERKEAILAKLSDPDHKPVAVGPAEEALRIRSQG